MEAKIIEFHLEYNPDRKNPADVFHAMGHFISAYQMLGSTISHAIGSEYGFDIELKEVTKGCILAKLALKAEELTRPDSMIRSFIGEVSSKNQVQEVTEKESNRLKGTGRKLKIEPHVGDLDTALGMKEWSKGNEMLDPDEYLKVCKEGEDLNNVVPFSSSFRFTGNINKMFSKSKGHHDGEEVIEVFKPCNQGSSKWEVISRATGRQFSAEILDTKWLKEYQNSETRLGGKDYLRVHSEYDVVLINDKVNIQNAKIKEVIDIIECSTGTQNEIQE
ncbi:hypothetical protein BCU68_16430 [Vibrio sp. 10N.286.49.B3]|uniref:hypothetical protein n=1 Tax=Vibrio sp. 10N.286.49.B3 TaxID=1880855 RepID=UPI000C81FAEF|nr:hypothetical protein [Vibrio sp. 10N.286.49.B3]PMH40134.1 hypothetical protein BCU68_16430 [Vibrio sp. 10N.286.49.B3]